MRLELTMSIALSSVMWKWSFASPPVDQGMTSILLWSHQGGPLLWKEPLACSACVRSYAADFLQLHQQWPACHIVYNTLFEMHTSSLTSTMASLPDCVSCLGWDARNILDPRVCCKQSSSWHLEVSCQVWQQESALAPSCFDMEVCIVHKGMTAKWLVVDPWDESQR